MTFITARDLRLKTAELWKTLEEDDEIVVTMNGRPCAIITGVSPDDLEESLMLLKRLRAQIALSKMRRAAAKGGLDKLSASGIDKEIKSARRATR